MAELMSFRPVKCGGFLREILTNNLFELWLCANICARNLFALYYDVYKKVIYLYHTSPYSTAILKGVARGPWVRFPQPKCCLALL